MDNNQLVSSRNGSNNVAKASWVLLAGIWKINGGHPEKYTYKHYHAGS